MFFFFLFYKNQTLRCNILFQRNCKTEILLTNSINRTGVINLSTTRVFTGLFVLLRSRAYIALIGDKSSVIFQIRFVQPLLSKSKNDRSDVPTSRCDSLPEKNLPSGGGLPTKFSYYLNNERRENGRIDRVGGEFRNSTRLTLTTEIFRRSGRSRRRH